MSRGRHSRTEPSATPIAFYAPLKPPCHPNPSGDRLIARLMLQALAGAGFEPQLASRFRSREGQGDPIRQQRLKSVAQRLADRLIRRYRKLPADQRPRLWFSYHLYHKAPDWIGPRVSQALGIPYVVAEASYAAKQANGPWANGLADTTAAIEQAELILSLNPQDDEGLRQCRADAPIRRLYPFVPGVCDSAVENPREQLAQRLQLDPDSRWLICVAMMRPGDKLHSFQLLADSLQQLPTQDSASSNSTLAQPWQLLVVGDGRARNQVEQLFAPLQSRVRFLGRLQPSQIEPLLQASDLYVWPAVNEAFGMALLEALQAGTPVLAGDEGGVSSLVENGNNGWLTPARDSNAFAQTLQQLLQQPERLTEAGTNARERVDRYHSLHAAGQRLQRLLMPLISPTAAGSQSDTRKPSDA
ncbi:glycosyltransferase [Motiliproteus coralliicola]|uniref:Glycosyltransferase n=1 Tax=Motiliproteus coralliicola TaxID=2283196 RepID=A0A369WG27_9GAMM|nr:glycosyltransferase family 4 protein [Motiliproteus coralliicola]RDE19556.1 glycosyltransferase [Motiliproteus coralliicola]